MSDDDDSLERIASELRKIRELLERIASNEVKKQASLLALERESLEKATKKANQ